MGEHLQGFLPGPTQTGLKRNFSFKRKRDCSTNVVKTKLLISCAVTTQLICALAVTYANVFTYAKSRFFHNSSYFLEGFTGE